MAKQITYLLGAGASANTIPIVANMHKRIKEVILFLRYVIDPPGDMIHTVTIDEDLHRVLKNVILDLEWLQNEAGDYYTIDTLAKKFYLNNNDSNLLKLKRCLILYFAIEQIIRIPSKKSKKYSFRKDNVDKRYSSFLAAITKKRYPISGKNPDGLSRENLNFGLSNQIKIISWNYDMQFEMALKSMLLSTTVKHIKREFQILPNDDSKKEVNDVEIDKNSFAMVKLNGDASWCRTTIGIPKGKFSIFDGIDNVKDNGYLLTDLLKAYDNAEIDRKVKGEEIILPVMSFNFAWENDPNFHHKYPGHKINLQTAASIAANTEILVVIGYSFPIFNREIDNELFSKMVKLKKVYIQDKQPEKIKSTMNNAFEVLQKKIQTGWDAHMRRIEEEKVVNFHLDDNVDQFIIPYELTNQL